MKGIIVAALGQWLLRILLFISTLLSLSSFARAQELPLDAWEYYIQMGPEQGFADIIKNQDQIEWQKFEGPAMKKFGYIKGILWLRFKTSEQTWQTIRSWEGHPLLTQHFPSFSLVHYWNDGSSPMQESGRTSTVNTSLTSPGAIAFDLVSSSKWQYLQIYPYGPVNVKFKYEAENDYFLTTRVFFLAIALAIGAILTMAIYNLILFFSVKDPLYVFFALYTLSLALCIDAMYPALGFFVFIKAYFHTKISGLNISVLFLCIFYNIFANNFIDIKKYGKKRAMYLNVLAVVDFAALLFDFFFISPLSMIIVNFPMLLSMLSCLAVPLTLSKVSPRARFFATVFSIGIITTIIRHLNFIGVINGVWPNYMLLVGNVAQSTLFSLGLAQRLRELREELQKTDIARIESEKKAQEEEMHSKLLEKDLEAAEVVQQTLLPEIKRVEAFKFSSHYRAAEKTGGDWFNVYHDPTNNFLYLFVGDVTGHGIPSALITGVAFGAIHSAIHTTARNPEINTSLASIAQAVNNAIFQTSARTSRMMTMCFIGIDLIKRKAIMVNAGHNPPFYVTSGQKCKTLMAMGNRLGFTESAKFGMKEFDVAEGDILFLYTDGLIENTGPKGELISAATLKQFLSTQTDIDELKKNLLDLCASTWKEHPYGDDVTFLAMKLENLSSFVTNSAPEISASSTVNTLSAMDPFPVASS